MPPETTAREGTIKAAGIMYVENNTVLLLKRPDGSWAFAGGKIEDGESPLDAALRESSEEVGFKPDRDLVWLLDFSNNGKTHFTTFCAVVGFEPILNTDEHSEYGWYDFSSLPEPMHPNAKRTIENYMKSHMGYSLDTARAKDFNGWIEIKDNPISKAGIFPYLGRYIDKSLDPNKIYRVLRSPEELSKRECLESFRLIPWIDDHVMLGPSDSGMLPPERKGVEGVIGENVRFDTMSGKLLANLKVFSNNLDELIAGGKRELSAGYRCRYEISSGVWNGEPYDVIQRDIRGNHLALVKEGRMGPDVAVLDHMQFTFDARDAMADKDKEDDKKAMDAVNEALKSIGDSVKALDEKICEMDKRMAKDEDDKDDKDDKSAKDESEKDKDEKKAEDKKAMDSAIASAMDAALKPILESLEAIKASGTKSVLSEVRARDTLLTQLAEHGVAMDSADLTLAEVQSAGVDKLGLKAVKGSEQVALDAYFHNRGAKDEVGFALDHSQGKSTGKKDEAAAFYAKSA